MVGAGTKMYLKRTSEDISEILLGYYVSSVINFEWV